MDFSKTTVPSDLTDFVEAGEQAESRTAGTVRAVVKLEPSLFSAAKKWVAGQLDQFSGQSDSPGSVTWETIKYEQVRAKVRHLGIERTLVLGSEIDARNAPAFPIDVEQASDFHLDADDLVSKMGSLMDDVLTKDK